MYKRKNGLQGFLLVMFMALSMGRHAVGASSVPNNGYLTNNSIDDGNNLAPGETKTVKSTSSMLMKVRSFLKKMLGSVGDKHGQSIWGYVILLLILLGFGLGRRIGFVNQLVLAFGMLVFIPIVEWIKPPVEDFLSDKLGLEELSRWISLSLTFVLLSIFCFVQVVLHKTLSLLFTITFLSPFNKLIGGFFGMMVFSLGLGISIVLLEHIGIIISDDVLLVKELRFLVDKIWGEEEIVSWMTSSE